MELLEKRGYLTNKEANGDQFRIVVYQAVCRFQTDHGVEPTGYLDDTTLSLLIDGKENLLPSPTVWIPTNGGKKYHSWPGCKKMYYPRKISQQNAKALGIEPCGICY